MILHTGAKPVFADIKKDEFNIDPSSIEKAITKKTKAVIPVDVGGYPCDYDEIHEILVRNKKKYKPKKGTLQEFFEKPVILADCAHSFGASYKGIKSGGLADFSVFSFHAVKNLTTAEGGAVVFNSFDGLSAEDCYKKFQLLSLHGQNKDALSKVQAGSWRYSIDLLGYKFNMTDIQAAMGIAQLKRYDAEILPKRKIIYETYLKLLDNEEITLPPFNGEDRILSYHLFPVRIRNADEHFRDVIIDKMSERKIALNVHYIPIVMHPAYTKLGYKIRDYQNSYIAYSNEITLPLFSKMTLEEVEIVCAELMEVINNLKKKI